MVGRGEKSRAIATIFRFSLENNKTEEKKSRNKFFDGHNKNLGKDVQFQSAIKNNNVSFKVWRVGASAVPGRCALALHLLLQTSEKNHFITSWDNSTLRKQYRREAKLFYNIERMVEWFYEWLEAVFFHCGNIPFCCFGERIIGLFAPFYRSPGRPTILCFYCVRDGRRERCFYNLLSFSVDHLCYYSHDNAGLAFNRNENHNDDYWR